MRVVVGRVGRAHGIRGDLGVEVRTDEPDRRFAVGTTLFTESPTDPQLVIDAVKWHSGRLLVHFRGVEDRTAAERLRGLMLEVDVPADERPNEPDEYYDRQLVGLRVELGDGTQVGTLREIIHLPAHELLAVEREGRPDALVPFISQVVPTVDLAAGVVVIDPPAGLLDLDLDGGSGAAVPEGAP